MQAKGQVVKEVLKLIVSSFNSAAVLPSLWMLSLQKGNGQGKYKTGVRLHGFRMALDGREAWTKCSVLVLPSCVTVLSASSLQQSYFITKH